MIIENNPAMDVLADEILKTVLSEQFLNKQTLQPKVAAILKAFITKENRERYYKVNAANHNAVYKEKLLQRSRIETQHFKCELKKVHGETEMNEIYKSLRTKLKERGLLSDKELSVTL